MSASESTTIIDDTDSRIKYSSGWHMDGGPNEYNRTVHATSNAGASFTFRFNGTSVKVLGTLTQEGFAGSFPNTSYVLDGTTPITFSGKPSARVQYSQIFYQSPVDLPNTEHTLIGTCIDQNSLVWIDFFVVTSPSASTTSTTPTLSQSFVIVTTTVAASQDASRNASTSADFPVGAVVGGVIGAIFLVLIFMSLLLWHRRRPAASTATEMHSTAFPSGSMTNLISRPPISVDLSHPSSAASIYSSPSPIDVPSLISPSSASTAMYPPSTVPSGSSRKLRPIQPMQPLIASTSRTVYYREGDAVHGDHPPAYH